MKFSIIIPCYNHWELTHKLLYSLYQYSKNTEIVVIDDCSTDIEVSLGLNWWKSSRLLNLLSYKTSANLGFLRASNYGVKQASNEYVALISNDVEISNMDWVNDAIRILDSATVPTLIGARLLDFDTGWNTINGKVFPYLEGWLLSFKKSEWIKFGGFDERYCPYDFEDVDISTTYRYKGGALVRIETGAVHLGAQTYTYSEKRERQTRINQQKFREKWADADFYPSSLE